MDVEQTTNTDNPVGPSVVVVQDFTHVNQPQKREESPSKAKKFLQQLCVGLVLVAAVGIGVESGFGNNSAGSDDWSPDTAAEQLAEGLLQRISAS